MPTFGLPRDPAQWLALTAAIVVMIGARPLTTPWKHPRAGVAVLALVAGALSAAYVIAYLRGAPRIIDASSYYLEARAFAAGHLTLPVQGPEAATLGRFLLRAEPGRAAVIFPPGYPAVLAVGFLAHAPLAIGPLLALALALVTFDLARRIAPALPASSASTTSMPQIALLASVVCAALRYHTADTMSHGLAALCFTGALSALLAATDAASPRRALGRSVAAGVAAGWLFATRPVSALALGLVVLFLLVREASARSRRGLLLAGLVVGALPGVALFFAHQHAATGSFAVSAQRAYYAVSDGPPDCFRYGFGSGIGCLGEHGDFVRARLADGYGPIAAMGTTLRRLKMHLVDAGNLEILALLVPMGAWVARGSVRGRALGLAVVVQILVYAPFYFDGNYPGGGARFFADVLPLEHVLFAIAVTSFANRAANAASAERWAAAAIALACLGFSIRAGFDHAALRDRDGGRPFFEESVVVAAGASRGLVFVDTDHGFNLGFDPGVAPPMRVVRHHGDAHDGDAWRASGAVAPYRYRFEIPEQGRLARAWVEPMTFPVVDRYEGESLWPPVDQKGGWAFPEWAAGSCASGDRWLELHRTDERTEVRVVVSFPARELGGRAARVRVAVGDGARGVVKIAGRELSFAAPAGAAVACVELPPVSVSGDLGVVTMTVEPGRGTAALDAILF